MKNPSHPGAAVRDSIEELELTVTNAAAMLGVSRQALNNLVNEKSAISPEMAIRFEKMGWSNADFWMRLQLAYDMAQVRARENEIIVQRTANL